MRQYFEDEDEEIESEYKVVDMLEYHWMNGMYAEEIKSSQKDLKSATTKPVAYIKGYNHA